MTTRYWLGLSMAIAWSVAAPARAGQANTAGLEPGQKYDRFIVRYVPQSAEHKDPAVLRNALSRVGERHATAVLPMRRLAIGAEAIRTGQPLDAPAARRFMEDLARDAGVEYVEVDRRYEPLLVPNDTLYNQQFGFHPGPAGNNVQPAWDLSTGAGTVIAIVDTGVVAHPDLDANLVAGYDFISSAADARDGTGRDADPADAGDWAAANECGTNAARSSSWHGINVAGVAAAVTNNARGVAGIAFDARISPVRVLGRCGGLDSDISDAIIWASGGSVAGAPANANPADVINLSLGGTYACQATMQLAINSALSRGSVVVAASGNNNANVTGTSPANCSGVIAVSASGSTGGRSGYANYGSLIDVSAPGTMRVASNWGTTSPVASEDYTDKFGTSLAAPQVSGVVALMQAVQADTPANVLTRLRNTAKPMLIACPEGCGGGILDAAMAVQSSSGPVIMVRDLSLSEGTGGASVATFTVSLSHPAAGPVTYSIQTNDGTALAGSDYTASSLAGETIPAGSTSRTFAVTINPDAAIESDEAFSVSISNVTGATAGVAQAQALLRNDDGGQFVSIADVSVTEGNAGTANATFTATVPLAAASAITCSFATADGSAIAGVDYQAEASGQFSIGTGSTSTTFSVNVVGETEAELNETVLVNLKSCAGAQVSDWQAKATIINDDGATVSIEDATIVEGNAGDAILAFKVRMSAPVAEHVYVHLYNYGETATQAVDYERMGLSFNFAPGQVEQTYYVHVYGDTTVEDNETIVAYISSADVSILRGQALGTILNDDGPTLSVGDVVIAEGHSGTKSATFTVQMSQASAGSVTYDISTQGVTAVGGTDYTSTSLAGEAMTAGQTSRTFTVPIIGETYPEAAETFRVILSAATGASIFDGQATGTIVNDDGPKLTINDVAIAEGATGSKVATFTVKLSQASDLPVTYNISTVQGTATVTDGDFSPAIALGDTIAPGITSRTFEVTLYGDPYTEANETFAVNVGSVAGAVVQDGQAVGTILNDDGPTLSVTDASIAEGPSGTRQLVFTVRLSQAAGSPVTYDIATASGTATAGSDFVAGSSSAEVIPAGMLSKTFAVTINGDALAEANETLLVNLSNAAGGATILDAQGIGYVLNDDGPTLSVADVAIAEGDSGPRSMTFTISLSQVAAGPVNFAVATANGTAVAGTDYVAAATGGLVIAAGQTSRAFAVTLGPDANIEPDETFTLRITGAVGATILDPTAVGTILDDDKPALSIGDVSTTEGNSGTKSLTFTVSLAKPAAAPVSYTVFTANGTATAGSDYLAKGQSGVVIPAGMTAKTFAVTVNGDVAVEPSETFLVLLRDPVGARLADDRATGNITNDD